MKLPTVPSASNGQGDIKWIEGLRGIAAFMVVTGHVSNAIWPKLLAPVQSKGGSALVMQWPIVRLLFAGRVSVAMFALIAGYVNAMKPIKLVRAGEIDQALSSIALSAFKRTGRLVLPTSVATFAAWFLTQLGGFEAARHAKQDWIRNISPRPSASWMHAITSLVKNLVTTWTKGANDYDKVQWTITFFLRAAMLTYMTLIATVYVKSKHRLMIMGGLYCYYWCAGDCLIGINIAFGMILAELSQGSTIETVSRQLKQASTVIASCLISLGLLICSFPPEHSDWTGWSNRMAHIAALVMPSHGELTRYVHSVGAQILFLGIMFSPTAKQVLSHRWLCWTGKTSFAVYLIHPLFVRSILVWMMYGTMVPPPGPIKDGKPTAPGTMKWNGVTFANFAAFPTFYLSLYLGASYWTRFVDPWCGQAMQRLETLMFAAKPAQTNGKTLLPK